MNKKEKKIIEFYKVNKTINGTWRKFYSKSRNEITKLLRSAGVLQAKGGDRHRNKKVSLIPDINREFRYLTDKDLNFNKEIKSKLY